MDGLFNAEVEGVGDEGVADRDLVAPRYLLVKVGEVLKGEVVSGIEAKTAVASHTGGLDKGLDCCLTAISVTAAATGSTAPESTPIQKVFCRGIPSANRGMETIAPSGMFCRAMPSERASAAGKAIAPPPYIQPANATPTAMPSGRLWSVTARSSFSVLRNGALRAERM